MGNKIWAMLDETAPEGCEPIQDLYSWSSNYDAGKGPFTLFLDLIGWSDDNIGCPLYSMKDAEYGFGPVELDMLAKALTAYAERPHDVRDYVDELMNAEAEG